MLKNVVFSAIDSVEFGDHRGKYSDTSEFFEFVRPGGCGKWESGYKMAQTRGGFVESSTRFWLYSETYPVSYNVQDVVEKERLEGMSNFIITVSLARRVDEEYWEEVW